MKKILLSLFLSVVLVVSSGAMCCAATAGLTITVTTSKSNAKYSYGSGGNIIKVVHKINDKHPETGDTSYKKDSTVVTGAYTTASNTLYPHSSYKITKAKAVGYLNGVKKGTLTAEP